MTGKCELWTSAFRDALRLSGETELGNVEELPAKLGLSASAVRNAIP